MKKIIGAVIVITLTILFCTGCEVSNTELANSLDGNMTRLVYSIGYLDSVSTSDIQDLVTNTSYFTQSTYNANGATSNLSGANALRNSNYRTSTFANNLSNGYANYVSDDVRTYSNTAINNFTNCSNCNTPLTIEPAIGEHQSSTATNTGNATTSELGGLCGNCKNIETSVDTISDATNINDINVDTSVSTTNTLTNYVDMSLLESSSADLNEILLEISQKRGIIMLYCTDLRSGHTELSVDDKNAISEYITIIKETTNYLNNNSNSLTAHINNIKNIAYTEGAQELINAKLIRANEVLKTRYAKLDTCTDSLDAIISILQRNIGIDYSSTYLNNSSYTYKTNTNDLSNSNIINNSTTTTKKTEQNSNGIITTESIQANNANTNNTYNQNMFNTKNDYNKQHNINSNQNSSSNATTPLAKNNEPQNTIINYNYSGSDNDSYNVNSNPNSLNNRSSTLTTEPTNNVIDQSLANIPTINTQTPNCQPIYTSNNIGLSATDIQGGDLNTTNTVNNLSNVNTTSLNPRGIGIQTESNSPLTGIPYDSTSVNVPKPGTLISAIGVNADIKNNNPVKTEELTKDNELKLVDTKSEKSEFQTKSNNIGNNFNNKTETIQSQENAAEPILPSISKKENIQSHPLIENVQQDSSPGSDPQITKNNKRPLVIKELGFKNLIEPIYSEESTFKLLPFQPNL